MQPTPRLFFVLCALCALCMGMAATPAAQARAAQRAGTPTPPATASLEQQCKRPPDDYRKLKLNGYTVNRRTYAMLAYAAALYHGEIDLLGASITQGSYNNSVKESFGTHAGGGAVDISVVAPNRSRYVVLYDDVEPLVHALRQAGFAAWFRRSGELSPGSPMHIHAIAIGDKELSRAAQDQLTGPYGYFYNYNGLPQKSGTPQPDAHGGALFCAWMRASGYPTPPVLDR